MKVPPPPPLFSLAGALHALRAGLSRCTTGAFPSRAPLLTRPPQTLPPPAAPHAPPTPPSLLPWAPLAWAPGWALLPAVDLLTVSVAPDSAASGRGGASPMPLPSPASAPLAASPPLPLGGCCGSPRSAGSAALSATAQRHRGGSRAPWLPQLPPCSPPCWCSEHSCGLATWAGGSAVLPAVAGGVTTAALPLAPAAAAATPACARAPATAPALAAFRLSTVSFSSSTLHSAACGCPACGRPSLLLHAPWQFFVSLAPTAAPSAASAPSAFSAPAARAASAAAAAANPGAPSASAGGAVRASLDNADPTLMSAEEMRAVGARPHPPGEHPGAPLHQQGRLGGQPGALLLSPELRPLLPLFLMVLLGLLMAAYTMAWELFASPDVSLSKRRRRSEVPEMHEAQQVMRERQLYESGVPFRKLAHQDSGLVGGTKKFFEEPPVLPGDDPKAVGLITGKA